MANATKLEQYGIYSLVDSNGNPLTTVGNISSTSTTSFEFSAAAKNELGAVLTGNIGFVLRTLEGKTEIIFAPAASSTDGISWTGMTRGVLTGGYAVDGSDNPTGSSDNALDNIPEGSIVDCVLLPQQYLMILKAIDGTIATGGNTFYIGDETDGNPTFGYRDTGGNKVLFRYNHSTSKAQYSNDGSTWINMDTAAPANVTTRSTTNASANDGEIYRDSADSDSLVWKDDGGTKVKLVDDATQKIPLATVQTYFAADGEASDAYAITLAPAPSALVTGQSYYFSANTANTGAATLNVNTLGAKTIKKLNDQDLEDGDIESGQIVHVIYDGTNMQLQTPLATNLTSAQAATLTDGSNADSLHTHSFNQKIAFDTTGVDLTGTISETDLFSTTISGNTLGTASAIKVKIYVDDVDVADTKSIIFKLKYGTTSLITTQIGNTLGGGNAISNNTGFIEGIIYATGATDSQKGVLQVSTNNLNSNWSPFFGGCSSGTSTEDSTGDLTFSITATLSSTTGISISTLSATCELITV